MRQKSDLLSVVLYWGWGKVKGSGDSSMNAPESDCSILVHYIPLSVYSSNDQEAHKSLHHAYVYIEVVGGGVALSKTPFVPSHYYHTRVLYVDVLGKDRDAKVHQWKERLQQVMQACK